MVAPDAIKPIEAGNLFRVVKCIVSEEVLAGAEIPGGGGKKETIANAILSHQNDFCIQMGSDESHFSISFTVTVSVREVTRQCPQNTTFEERGEPNRN